MNESLTTAAEHAMSALDPAWWSASVVDRDGSVLLSHRADEVRSIASVGKLLLLAELDARLDVDPSEATQLLSKTAADMVSDSGLWQHLTIGALSVNDLAVLISSVSDNLATNVLLRHIGLDSVAERARTLGLQHTRLHDRVRDQRSPTDPPQLSSGSAAELTRFLGQCPARLFGWMGLNTDHSMVAAPFGLDPLLRGGDPIHLANKTGTDEGVRCDVGLVDIGDGATRVAYALLVNWPAHAAKELDVLAAMRDFGDALRTSIADRNHG